MKSATRTNTRHGSVWFMSAAVCLLLFALLWQGCAGKVSSSGPAKKGEGSAAAPVSVTRAYQKDVPIESQVVGRVEAYLKVNVKAQVDGELTRVFFREGDFVRKGEPLFEIDRRALESQLDQSKANLARDEAQLGMAEANLARDEAQEKYALAESERQATLLKKGLASREEAEQGRANADAISAAVRADAASVRSAQAAISASQAAVANAEVKLGYTTIRSPLDGRSGDLGVQQGNVVSANTTTLVTINQVEPIYVTFSVPETELPMLRRSQAVAATPRDDPSPPEGGELSFIDNEVDPSTGTIRLKATFRNSDHKLWPGEFVRVTLRLATRPHALVVPNEAVQPGQDGPYVFVVKTDRTVESRPVVIGPRIGQEIVIEKGLQPGETVVTEGQLRLAPGSRVQIMGGTEDPPGTGGSAH